MPLPPVDTARRGKSDSVDPDRPWHSYSLLAISFGALALLRVFSYLLFHSFAELYSIIIAATYFVISWHTRRINDNPSIVYLGIAYLFVAILDIFHTLAYTGMGVFPGYDFPANQVWVLARVLEASSLLIFSFLERAQTRKFALFIALYAAYSIAGLAAIFAFRVFPACFIAGRGQTPFKIAMELLIIAILLAAALVLRGRRERYLRSVYHNLQLSIFFTGISELSFMLYISNFDWLNMGGHLLKIASFYLVYRSIVVTGLERPHEVLFSRLRTSEENLFKANEAKDNFISILSHDLRSPLSGMMSVAEGLGRFRSEMRAEQVDESLEELRRTAESSLALVERVLAWARSQSGALKPELQPVLLAPAIAEEAELLAESARAKDILLSIEIPEDAQVSADREMLAAILRNLIQNAVKFTGKGGKVELRAFRSQAAWSIEVRDTGVGMSEVELERAFRVDRRLRNTGTAGERGAGFGLILSAEFARQLGGRLEAESEKGMGSTFRLVLPAVERRKAPRQA